jgi:hypothetical protein
MILNVIIIINFKVYFKIKVSITVGKVYYKDKLFFILIKISI